MELSFLQQLVLSLVSGGVGGYATYRVQEAKLRKEYQLQDSAERVAHALLSDTRWHLRTFDVIRHHLGGFTDAELRQILVRAGAIRFMSKSGHEVWGLVSRNSDLLGETQLGRDPEGVSPDGLFKN